MIPIKQIIIKGLRELPPDFLIIDINRPVIPRPQQIMSIKNLIQVKQTLNISYTNINENEMQRLVMHTKESLTHHHPFQISIQENIENEIIGCALPKKQEYESYLQSLESSYQEQSYFISINNREIIIQSITEVGLYYGFQTLSQLIYKNQNKWVVQEQQIFDYPTFLLRGITDQQCHGQVGNMKSIKRQIKFLSRYKNNCIGFNLEDIMGFDEWDKIGKERGAFTKVEIKEIVKYAKHYYMEVIPGFQGLGHLESFLYHKEFREYAEFPGANSVNLSYAKTYDLLEKWYREIDDKFQTNFINLLMDESYDFGKFHSKMWVEKNGKIGKVFNTHLNWLYRLIHDKLGKEILIYHDSLLKWAGEEIEEVPKDIKIIYWDYLVKPKYKKIKSLAEKGYFVIASPSIINWSRPFPHIEYSLRNIKAVSQYGAKNGAKGFINSSWGDFSNENLRSMNYYGFGLGSEFAWNPLNFEEDHFSIAFFYDFFGMTNGHLFWDFLLELNKINRGGPWITPFFERLWEHPLPPHKPSYPKKDAKKDLKVLKIAKIMFETSKKTITLNQDLLEYFEYIFKIMEFNANKAINSHLLYKKKKKEKSINQNELEETKKIQNLNSEIWDDYKELWLRAAKSEGLERIEKKKESLDEGYSQIINNIWQIYSLDNPYLQSEWISHPQFSTWFGGANIARPVIFKKTFQLNELSKMNISYAKIQVIAHTYAKIYVNSNYGGEVISRHFLSPVIFDNSVQIFDISKYLVEGKNDLIIEAWEFSGSITSCNFYAEITFANEEEKIKKTNYSDSEEKKILIISDEDCNSLYISNSQLISPELLKNFNSENLLKGNNNNQWVRCKSLGKPPKFNGAIWKPNLKKEIPSRISHSLGKWEYQISMVLMTIKNRFLQKLIRKILMILI